MPVKIEAKAGEKCTHPKANAKQMAAELELFRNCILNVY